MDEQVARIFEQVAHIDGWLKDEEMVGLIKVALRVKQGGNIYEIGTALGRSTCLLALACPDSKVYTIDNMTARFHENMPIEDFQDRVKRNTDGAGVTDRVIFKIGDFRKDDWREPISLLYIDGKQTFGENNDAFRKFSPFIEPGGFLCIRDYLTVRADHENGRWVDQVLAKDENFDTHIEGQFVWSQKK
jgi:predicted O-methyltransferase YrrM